MALDPKITGGMGMAPPPGAPRETTVAGSERATADQIRRARANEQELPAFSPKPMTDAQIVALTGKTAAELQAKVEASSSSRRVVLTDVPEPVSPPPAEAIVTSSIKPPDIPRVSRLRRPGVAATAVATVAIATNAQEAAAVEIMAKELAAEAVADLAETFDLPAVEETPVAPAVPPSVPKPAPHQPAASDSDTPSRGLPTFSSDAGKQITGGFGSAGDAQYIPLDGTELRTLVESLMDNVHARLQDDLRFSIAAVYPRVTARVVVEIDCFVASDQSFQVQKVMTPHDKTPKAIARDRADECVFFLVEQRQEMDADGQSIAPPNATREELGLPVPRKQAVQTPGGRMIVDIVASRP